MENLVFDYSSYKPYLEHRLGSKSQRKGLKSKLASTIGIQPAYLSQVLNGLAHLSLEQAEAANTFFGHSQDEAHYFLLLIQKERAGTQPLAKYFDQQINEQLKKRMTLTKRLGSKNGLSKEDHSTYYSSWHYAAIHIALTIPQLQSAESLAIHFRLPQKRVQNVLLFLREKGLATIDSDGGYRPGENFIRLGNDSPNIVQHHTNWRLSAVNSLHRETQDELHYSAVVSLSKKDIKKIKDRILEEIKNNIEIVKQSKEEELYSYCIDFFSLKEES